MNSTNPLLARLRYHVTGAIERGEGVAIVGIPAKPVLLAIDSPLYLKRLSRELMALPDGFYYASGPANVRCNAVRYRCGFLEIKPCGNLAFRAIPSDTTFTDAYGRRVCASRQA